MIGLEEEGKIFCLRDVRTMFYYCTGIDNFGYIPADRGVGPLREDLPLPTQPPYTAFIGNLAFDLTEIDLEEFFAGHKVCHSPNLPSGLYG